jgi:hypothetical protein
VSDLLFRGRGANIGVRAPAWQLRVAGALLALGLMELLDGLGVFEAAGLSITWARVTFMAGGALLAPSAVGVWLWGATAAAAGVLLHGVEGMAGRALAELVACIDCPAVVAWILAQERARAAIRPQPKAVRKVVTEACEQRLAALREASR